MSSPPPFLFVKTGRRLAERRPTWRIRTTRADELPDQNAKQPSR